MKNNSILNKKNLAKHKKWNDLLKKIDNTADNLGMPIDKDVQEAVVAMNLLGFRTMGSCQGHIDKRILFPYIYCEIKGQPKYQYKNEKEIKKKLMHKYNIKSWKMVYVNNDSGNNFWHEYILITNKLKYSNVYNKWMKKNEPLGKKIAELIKEFNKNRKSTTNNKLQVMRVYPGYRIVTLNVLKEKKLNNNEKKKLIKLSQKKFEEFTMFLKNKYFSTK